MMTILFKYKFYAKEWPRKYIGVFKAFRIVWRLVGCKSLIECVFKLSLPSEISRF